MEVLVNCTFLLIADEIITERPIASLKILRRKERLHCFLRDLQRNAAMYASVLTTSRLFLTCLLSLCYVMSM